ncbi:[FeFe] hydrogenase H-cluster radical SAM maturase HydE [Shewanella intestini]|uniref:[FeFe] hydrogenase H-cluster radical SAM maturase HydE n=1 Tax=Shewanella intestini TaxID=2017544 RepID=A0ABS5I2Z8_9GAMM|nr:MULTISPECIES: [FeFe] hydrogenase H-cluster radical SAM maturase HydE [Shewanella]MBR9728396.1 [FeFe] hydrogenase H-cluster radical SAM maturase HydE [Shewanella intestini]MRG36738.1 [FeFe] hydrogenase H-cluster radical SAM maturase HydE [Shewanella sp. XMDDZSB0408]
MTAATISPMALNKQQILSLLQGQQDTWLFDQAQRITSQVFADNVYLRGIVEFSNYCLHNCHYCGLRSANRKVVRYRLSEQEILSAVDNIVAAGLNTVVLQSGDDKHYRSEVITRLIVAIKQKHDIAITLSLGDRHSHELQQWRAAGADRYLLKMETFDQTLFEQCRPKADFHQRLHQLKTLQSLGYQTGSGIITDLPGTTDERLANDILTLTQMELDMLACGPFVAHQQTPFADEPNGNVLTSQRVSAILRLMNPYANIPATSSLEVLTRGAREQALLRGCNVIMPSFTPEKGYVNYSIYPGKNASTIATQPRLNAMFEQINAHGLHPCLSRGDSKRNPHVPRN